MIDDTNDWANIRRRIVRRVLPAFAAVAAIAGLFVWLDCRETYRKQLNADLIFEVQIGTPSEVRDLLARGADPNARDTPAEEPVSFWQRLRRLVMTMGRARSAQGEPVLVCACSSLKHRAEVVRLLVEHGASVNAHDDYGDNALLAAANAGDPATVQFLLSRGAVVNPQDSTGSTALECAARSGNPETVQLLLSRGVAVNTTDSTGRTPLDCAVLSAEPRVVKMLLDRGANAKAAIVGYASMMSSPPTTATTLLGLARTLSPGPHRSEIVRLLKQAGAK